MIKNPVIQYLNKITFFSIGVCFLVMLLWLTPAREYLRTSPFYIGMYYIVTFAFWLFLYYVQKKQTVKFEQAYMISRAGKIILYVLIFVIILLCGWEKNTKFAFAYLGLYLFYLIFDTITTMQLVRKQQRDNKKIK